MRTVVVLASLLLVPASCYAHSGTVAKTVANYIPVLLIVVPMVLAAISNRVKGLLAMLRRLVSKD